MVKEVFRDAVINSILFNSSEIWSLGDEYRKTYREYAAKGFKDVRATSQKGKEPEHDEISAKKLKEEGDDSWENVVFIRTNFNNSE